MRFIGGVNSAAIAIVASSLIAITAAPASASPPSQTTTADQPRRWSLHGGLGFGDAVCDNEKPDSDCPVDGAFTIALGGAWHFHSRFSLVGELAIWGYQIRDAWQGGLSDPATDVAFSSVYLAPMLRWRWFDESRRVQPYLQGGIGIGSVSAKASNDTGTYEYSASGVVFPLGIGVDWRVGKRWRVGPQAQAYLQVSNEICAQEPGMSKDCRSPGTNDDGDREGLLLPWRIVVVGTFEL